MSSSSKVMFNLENLKSESLKSIDERIARQKETVDSFHDDAAFESLVSAWRRTQENRIAELLSNMAQIDTQVLSKFKFEDMPSRDEYEQRSAVRELDRMHTTRSKIVAKTESLVPDEAGNISLTKTQLAEFFGL